MNGALLFLGGAAAGALAYRLLTKPSNCCDMIARAARTEAIDYVGGGTLGSIVGAVGDLGGLWDAAPGLINLFGVKL